MHAGNAHAHISDTASASGDENALRVKSRIGCAETSVMLMLAVIVIAATAGATGLAFLGLKTVCDCMQADPPSLQLSAVGTFDEGLPHSSR